MHLRSFDAPSMKEAMASVRRELGDDAVIVSTGTGRQGRGVRVVAAIEPADPDEAVLVSWDRQQDAPSGTRAAAGTGSDTLLADALAYHRVPAPLLDRLARAAGRVSADKAAAETKAASAPERPEAALSSALEAFLSFQPLGDAGPCRPLTLVGPAGAGKTLTAAKLVVAAHSKGRAVRAVSTDTRRAGGIEQLEAFTRILGLPLTAEDDPPALARLVEGAADAAVIIDTAGVNPFSAREMQSLARLIEAAQAEPVLVLAMGGDPVETGEVATAFARLGCRRMIATRLDVTRRLGALLTAGETGRLSIAGVAYSPHAVDAPAPLGALSLARLLLSAIPGGTPAPQHEAPQ